MTNDLLGGTITYAYERYTPMNPAGLKYRYRVLKQTNSGGAGTSDVVRDFKYTCAWRDNTTGEFRGHDYVAAVDSAGYWQISKFYTAAGANGKSQEDCNFLKGRAYREGTLKDNEVAYAVNNYASDLSAADYGRGGWSYAPGKFTLSTSGVLYIGLIRGTTYYPMEHRGKLYHAPPNTVITRVEFDWESNYNNAHFILAMDYPDHPEAWASDQFGPQSGHQVVEIAGGADWVAFGLFTRTIFDHYDYTYPTDEWHGRISNLKIYYRSVLQSRDNTWDYVTTLGEARHIRLTRLDETLDGKPRRTDYAYDTYGNCTKREEYGEGSSRYRAWRASYYANQDAWIVEKKQWEEVVEDVSGVETQRRLTRYYYDGLGWGVAPSKGDLTRVQRVYMGDESKNSSTDYWYDAYGNLIREQDGRGNQTSATYDATYHTFLATITNAKNQVETRAYDPASGRPTSVTDINGQTTTYEYDAFKRLIKVRRPGDGSPAPPTIEYVYFHNPSQPPPRFTITTKRRESGSSVYETKSWYDGLGRVVQSRRENAAGANPLVVDTNYDGRGLQSSQSVPYPSASNTWDYTTPDTSQPKTTYLYEGLRRPREVTNPEGTTKKCYYVGRTTVVVDEKNHRRDLINDPFDRLVKVEEYSGADPNVTLYATTTYSYDVLDDLVQVSDQAGNVTKMGYNPLGQRVRMHDPDRCGSNNPADASYWWSYEYDLAGNLTSQTDARGQTITFTYDELNRPKRRYYPMRWTVNGVEESHWVSEIVAGVSKPSVYDLMELRSAVGTAHVAAQRGEFAFSDAAIVAGQGVKVRGLHFNELRSAMQNLWTVGNLGIIPEFSRGPIVAPPTGYRLISAQDPQDLRSWLEDYDGRTSVPDLRARVFYRYDDYTDNVNRGYPKGRRTEMWDAAGHTRWTYDERGRMLTEEHWTDGQLYTTQWSYDAMDRVKTLVYPDGETLTYTYGEQAQLVAIASSTGVSYLASTTYNQLLKPKVLTLGSGATTTFSYYGTGLDAAGAPYGALKGIATSKAGLPTIQELQQAYDNLGNLTRWQDLAAGEDFTYEYDDLDRPTKRKVTNGADLETLAYDQIGNITSQNGSLYTYGNPPVHGVSAFAGVGYSYDGNGNMVRSGNWYLKYDAENRLVKVSGDAAGYQFVARFAYDGDGARVKRVDDYGTIHYVGRHYQRNVGNGQDTSEKITKYYYATLGSLNRLIALRRDGVLYYVHSDHLGGTVRVSDAGGNIVDSITYTAYGQTRSGGANLPTDRRFTGQTLDLSTGLYWYSTRPYSALLGRFTQPDTVVPDYQNPQSLNRYGYCLNNSSRHKVLHK
ncbi:MAG: hypothetical protein M1136_08265 [Chloroflexi bacterium]|nr:hypothetical protein [Chloroflexota bacterium]MCL5075626.1 hypothetical protein [Chloroflexota bacterium]